MIRTLLVWLAIILALALAALVSYQLGSHTRPSNGPTAPPASSSSSLSSSATTSPAPSPTRSSTSTPTPTPSPTTSTPTPSPPAITGGDSIPKTDTLVGRYVTHYPPAQYRNINQARAAWLINGTILQPGEQFSFNQIVGERTRAHGFVRGYVIVDGVYQLQVGGGVSQVATTLYNAALEAGLRIDERHPHSFYIDRYPTGRDATVAWGSWDLKFTNTSPYPVRIHTWVKPSTTTVDGAMHASIWSARQPYRVVLYTAHPFAYTSPHTRHLTGSICVPNTGYDGFTVNVTRTIYKNEHGTAGSTIPIQQPDRIHTVYEPSDTVICN